MGTEERFILLGKEGYRSYLSFHCSGFLGRLSSRVAFGRLVS